MRTRLLERLNQESGRRTERRLRDQERLLVSVRNHVSNLLNTRRGNVPIDPSYGMPAAERRLNESGAPDGELIQSVICDLLQRYEPRLRDVDVQFRGLSANQLGLEMEITGTVAHPKQDLPLRLAATMLADGRFTF